MSSSEPQSAECSEHTGDPGVVQSFRHWFRLQPKAVRVALFVLVLFSLALHTVGVGWGLPNGNRSWSADALQPLTPLAIGRHVLFGDSWNSGWFYFKYPVGHPLVLLAAQGPLLVGMWLSGELQRPQRDYPYGFKDPERSLARLSVVTRLVSAIMGTAVVFFAYCIVALLLSSAVAGLWSAVTVAGLYPLVFYSHTSNVDVPLLFWLALCCCAVLWSARTDSRRATVLAGAGAAMALLTKEQGIGFLLAMPVVWVLTRSWRPNSLGWAGAWRHASAGALAFAVVTVIVANVLWNPAGYVNRWRFLLGTLPAETREKYAPYQFLTQVPQTFSLAREAAKFERSLSSVMHVMQPAAAAAAGVGVVLCAWLAPRAVVALGLAGLTYYLASLRALELVQVRYVLPLAFVACLAVGGIGALIERRGVHRIGAVMLAVWALVALAPGVETVRLLLSDPRYAAERWFAAHGPAHGVRAEIYQPLTYLPRFPLNWEVKRVRLAERTREKFLARMPDLVVLSSAGSAGLTGTYRRQRQPGESFFEESPAAQDFIRALRAGELGYDLAAEFQTPTWLRSRIPSLNPKISVYRRRGIL
ncbi:MAG: hypothetical protein KatS3mg077_1017 [Candidatus Binatia bacterium]|nr:MAG: hypothetical protein KatS3mg077_1017 [Candidatus Binatia bacterium]